MEFVLGLAIFGLLVAMITGQLKDSWQMKRLLEHDRELNKQFIETYGSPKEIVDAALEGMAKSLVGYGQPGGVYPPATLPEGMDTLGLTEDTGMGGPSGVAYPEFEQHDPWMTQEVQQVIREMDAPSIQNNGAEPDDAKMGPVG